MSPDDEKLESLLDEYEARRERGETVTAEELCRDCPELAEELARRIKRLSGVDRFLEPTIVPAADATLDVSGEIRENVRRMADNRGLPVAGRYRAIELHARGGLGEVYLARDEELRRNVALKRMSREQSRFGANCRRFEMEAILTGSLEHPGIVPVYGLGQDADGNPVYAMKFIHGETLEDAIAQYDRGRSQQGRTSHDNLAFQQLLRRFLAVCQAVAYAHSHGIVHRDIKPANVMLGSYGETLLVDWGLAKQVGRATNEEHDDATGDGNGAGPPPAPLLDVDVRETQMGDIKGSPAYMSPEQAEGRMDLVGPASDIYSLGATLYRLLAGGVPFQGKTLEVLGRVKRGEFTRPREVRRGVPAGLEAICLKAMQRRPEDRYATALELAEDIEHWLADEPVGAWREPFRVRALRWVRRHRTLVASAGAALLVLVACLALATGMLSQKNQELTVAKQRTEDALASERRSLYVAKMNMAGQAYARGDVPRAIEVLGGLIPKADVPDLRGFEWHHLWRACHEQNVLVGHSRVVKAAAFFPDSRRIASGSFDRTVRLWDAETGKELAVLQGHEGPIFATAVSHDGQFVAAGGLDRTIRVWNVATGKLTATLQGEDVIVAVAFSPDGKTIAMGGDDDLVRLWDLATQTQIAVGRLHTDNVHAVAFSPDGSLLVSTSGDKTIRFWSAADLAPLGVIEAFDPQRRMETRDGHRDAVYPVVFSRDGAWIVTGSVDRTVRVWDVATRKLAFPPLTGHENRVEGVAISPDKKTVASADESGVLKLWKLEDDRWRLADSQQGHAGPIYAVTIAADGATLATASGDGTVKLWRTDALAPKEKKNESHAGRGIERLPAHDAPVTGVACSADGRHFATGAKDGSVKVWDVKTGQAVELAPQADDASEVFGVAFSPDGKLLIAATGVWSVSGKLLSWRLDEQGVWQPLELPVAHDSAILALDFSSDGRYLATGGMDNQVKLWEIVRKSAGVEAKLAMQQHHAHWVHGLAFSPDSTWLATAGHDAKVMLWDVARREPAAELDHTGMVYGAAFSPDDKLLATAAWDWTVEFWDIESLGAGGAANSPKSIAARRGHRSIVSGARFAPDGKTLATASFDGTVKLWHAATTEELVTLSPGGGLVHCLAFGPGGEYLVCGCEDGSLTFWRK